MEDGNGSEDELQGEVSGRPRLRKISPEGLRDIVEKHQEWLRDWRKGKSATLPRTDLKKCDLRSTNLQNANFRGSNLEEGNLFRANLEGADLWRAQLPRAALGGTNLKKAKLIGANLQRAYLRNANLVKATLTNATLRESSLQDADLTGVKGLQGGQLAGANVSGAKLPEDIRRFEEGLKVVEEASRNARKLFFAILSACAYALLTIATTTDVRLLTNSASSPLPIIRAEIPIVWFYIAAPLVLLCLYFYFHLYMQRLWEGLAKLPAVFPDGRSLDEKAYPWLLIGLVRTHVLHLREERPPLSHLQEWISIFLAWIFMPGTLICFWLRYIPRQDWFGTGFHIALLVVAVWAGVLFYRLAVGTLRMDETELPLWTNPFRKIMTYKRGVLAVRLGLILFLLSMGTINGLRSNRFLHNDVRAWVPYVFELFGFSPFANFRDKDVSTKPPNWSGKLEDIKGAPLRRRNLRYAKAKGAFLVNAQLLEANLYGASLPWANLRGADLWLANLRGTDLGWTKLQGAEFTSANLYGASLEYANLQGADLNGANLQEANLMGAKGLTDPQQLRRSRNWILAFYDEHTLDMLELLKDHPDHNNRLRRKELSGYKFHKFADYTSINLRGSNFSSFTLQGADLYEAKLQEAGLVEADLQDATLQGADLRDATLQGANLQGAKLEEANLQGADLRGAKNLTVEQLSKVKALYQAKLDAELMEQIKEKYPHLLEKPKED